MKLRHYLSLYPKHGFRLRLWLVLFAAGGLAAIGISRNEAGSLETGADLTFVLEVLFAPLCLGALFAVTWREPQHVPLNWAVPRFQSGLLRWHLGLLIAVTTFWTIFLAFAQPGLPVATAFAIVLGALTISLPFELVSLLSNARWAVLGLLVLAIAIATHPLATRERMLAHPWITAALGLLTVTGSIRLARKREAHRRRANRPAAFNQSNLTREFIERRQRQGIPSRPPSRKWSYAPRGDSLFRWVRAKFETQPGRPAIRYLITWGVLLLFSDFVAGMPLGWYHLVFQPDLVRNNAAGTIAMMMVWNSILTQQNPEGFYPLARRRRAQVTLVGFALSLATQAAAGIGGLLAVSYLTGLSLDLPTPPHLAAEFILRMGAAFIIVPLVQYGSLRWTPFHALRSQDNCGPNVLIVLTGMAFAQIVPHVVLHWGHRNGLSICVGGLVASQILLYFGLHRLFTKRDLMVEGTPRRCLGLT